MVDNEEADRELLVQLLEPRGFALRQASSGHDALDLLASGYRPDALLIDLAMPGIDGWETLRRVRQMHLEEVRSAPGRPKPDGAPSVGSDDTQCGAWRQFRSAPGRPKPDEAPSGGSDDTQCGAWGPIHCAIVSANAFDKALDNDVDIRPEDFIVKPVRHSELLDWLERRLGLQWQHDDATETPAGPAPTAASAAPDPLTYPDATALAALAQAVALGYYRGILNTLDDIERSQPAHSAFVDTMRQLAKQFQFDAMGQILEQAPS